MFSKKTQYVRLEWNMASDDGTIITGQGASMTYNAENVATLNRLADQENETYAKRHNTSYKPYTIQHVR